jgi:alginate O-acetyltransferase complex protein AlgI
MIFNQFEFLFLFLPAIVFLGLIPALARQRVWILVAASFVFYGYSGFEHAIVLAFGILWVYALMRPEHAHGSKMRVVLAILGPALALLYYKYSTFIVSDILLLQEDEEPAIFSLFENVLLPAGISFFTFQLISFAIDRYKGNIDHIPKFSEFTLYISFFPQLVAGPIVRHGQVVKSIHRLAHWRPRHEDLVAATSYIVLGLAFKVLLADTMARYTQPYVIAPEHLTIGASVYVTLAYSFQIYFDFYGYSLIAIGLGKIFGFNLPQNFNHPYQSTDPKDFWRKWHISLSSWIRDYLYVPLGGNKSYVKNIVIIFAITGLWHGAAWTFVVWGLYHATIVLGYAKIAPVWDKLYRPFRQLCTFILVSLGWILFIFDFNGVADFTKSLVGMGTGTLATDGAEMWIALGLVALVCFILQPESIIEKFGKLSHGRIILSIGLSLVFLITLMFVDVSNTFIYFRF